MAEAEKRMIEDELITDDLLLVGSAEFDGREELGGGGDAPFMRGGGGGRGRGMYSLHHEFEIHVLSRVHYALLVL